MKPMDEFEKIYFMKHAYRARALKAFVDGLQDEFHEDPPSPEQQKTIDELRALIPKIEEFFK